LQRAGRRILPRRTCSAPHRARAALLPATRDLARMPRCLCGGTHVQPEGRCDRAALPPLSLAYAPQRDFFSARGTYRHRAAHSLLVSALYGCKTRCVAAPAGAGSKRRRFSCWTAHLSLVFSKRFSLHHCTHYIWHGARFCRAVSAALRAARTAACCGNSPPIRVVWFVPWTRSDTPPAPGFRLDRQRFYPAATLPRLPFIPFVLCWFATRACLSRLRHCAGFFPRRRIPAHAPTLCADLGSRDTRTVTDLHALHALHAPPPASTSHTRRCHSAPFLLFTPTLSLALYCCVLRAKAAALSAALPSALLYRTRICHRCATCSRRARRAWINSPPAMQHPDNLIRWLHTGGRALAARAGAEPG